MFTLFLLVYASGNFYSELKSRVAIKRFKKGIGVRKPEAPTGFELETLEYKGGDVSRCAT